jgi:predicted RNA methylase
MDEILQDEINYTALEKKLLDFRTLLLDITNIDLNDLEDRKDLQFDNGIALCTTFAALCTQDVMRTRQFVKGIYQAIQDVQEKKSEPIHLFYAGTGPFATLILPILTKISSQDLRLHLMDVNEKTLEYLDKVLKTLDIQDYVENIICADATKYQIENPQQIDILVSETMQNGLAKEQQVPIMMNLVSQLNENAVIIPNNIQLNLALKSSSANFIMEWKNHLMYKQLTRLWDFTPEFIRSTDPNVTIFELCKDINFSNEEEIYDLLVVMTRIQTYQDIWLEPDICGLTIPKILMPVDKEDQRKISLSYVIKKQPDFKIGLV